MNTNFHTILPLEGDADLQNHSSWTGMNQQWRFAVQLPAFFILLMLSALCSHAFWD